MKLNITRMVTHSVALDTRRIQQPKTSEITGHNYNAMEFKQFTCPNDIKEKSLSIIIKKNRLIG